MDLYDKNHEAQIYIATDFRVKYELMYDKQIL